MRPTGGLTLVGPEEPRIRWCHDRTNLFAAAMGDKSAMRPFAKLFWPLVRNSGMHKQQVIGLLLEWYLGELSY